MENTVFPVTLPAAQLENMYRYVLQGSVFRVTLPIGQPGLNTLVRAIPISSKFTSAFLSQFIFHVF